MADPGLDPGCGLFSALMGVGLPSAQDAGTHRRGQQSPVALGPAQTPCVSLASQDLLEQHQVVEVGGNSIRLVTTASAQPWILRSVLRKGREEEDTDTQREDAQARPPEGPAGEDDSAERPAPPSQGSQGGKRRAGWASTDAAGPPGEADSDSAQRPPAKRPTLQDVRLGPRPRAEEATETPVSALPIVPEDAGAGEPLPGASEAQRENQGGVGGPGSPGREPPSCQAQLSEGSEDPRGTAPCPPPHCPLPAHSLSLGLRVLQAGKLLLVRRGLGFCFAEPQAGGERFACLPLAFPPEGRVLLGLSRCGNRSARQQSWF